MKIQPKEIRQAAVLAYNRGQTARMLSELFGVTLRTIQRWVRQAKDGQTAARPTGHRRRALGIEDEKKLEEILNKKPDATLEELCRIAEFGCHPATIHRTLLRMGYSFKKNAESKRTKSKGCG